MSVAKGISIYGNGVNLARAFKEYNPTADRETHDATTLSDTSKVWEFGFKNGTISVNAVWKYDETDLDEVDNIISAAYANDTNVILTASKTPLVVGGNAELADAFITKYSKPAQYGQLLMLSADFQATGGINYGVWLFSADVESGTTAGSGVDNGAATNNGGVFHAHAQNITLADLSDGLVRLQHSVDNSTWVDLFGFTAFAAEDLFAAMSVEIPAGTTVRRYLRVAIQADSGRATFQAAFARR